MDSKTELLELIIKHGFGRELKQLLVDTKKEVFEDIKKIKMPDGSSFRIDWEEYYELKEKHLGSQKATGGGNNENCRL